MVLLKTPSQLLWPASGCGFSFVAPSLKLCSSTSVNLVAILPLLHCVSGISSQLPAPNINSSLCWETGQSLRDSSEVWTDHGYMGWEMAQRSTLMRWHSGRCSNGKHTLCPLLSFVVGAASLEVYVCCLCANLNGEDWTEERFWRWHGSRVFLCKEAIHRTTCGGLRAWEYQKREFVCWTFAVPDLNFGSQLFKFGSWPCRGKAVPKIRNPGTGWIDEGAKLDSRDDWNLMDKNLRRNRIRG